MNYTILIFTKIKFRNLFQNYPRKNLFILTVNFGDIDKHKDPTIVELTFMHNSLCKKEKIKNYNLPIKGLDFPNKENRDDVKLFFDVS